MLGKYPIVIFPAGRVAALAAALAELAAGATAATAALLAHRPMAPRCCWPTEGWRLMPPCWANSRPMSPYMRPGQVTPCPLRQG